MGCDATQFIRIQGYHTCKLSDCLDSLLLNAPFKSTESNEEHWQWLGTGYYFWTDSCIYAHRWGSIRYKTAYAIVECSIEIDGNRYLDLVGDVSDQQFFLALIEEYEKKLTSVLEKKGNASTNNVSVCKVIDHYKSKDLFPFDAVKASDNRYDRTIPFTPDSRETLVLVTRQQLCLFEEATDKIVSKQLFFANKSCN